MAKLSPLPERLSVVHRRAQQPSVAARALTWIVMLLALIGTMSELPSAVALLLFATFASMSAGFVVLKKRVGDRTVHFETPIAVPLAGAIICAAIVNLGISAGDVHVPLIAVALPIVILALLAVQRNRPGIWVLELVDAR